MRIMRSAFRERRRPDELAAAAAAGPSGRLPAGGCADGRRMGAPRESSRKPPRGPLAVDVAILLPAAAGAVAARLNAGFDHAPDAGFRFDASHHPHVTLSQHFVPRERLSEVRRLVGGVVARFEPFEAHVTGARAGRTAQVLTVEASPPLRELHERLMDALPDHEVAGGPEAFQAPGAPARPADVAWVAGFRARSSYTRYDPHVTIGIGPGPISTAPFRFSVEEIALCRLGRFCTCRDGLAGWML